MISRKLPGAFVCLRCQLQGASANKSRSLARVPRISTPTSLFLKRRFASDAANPLEEELDRDIQVDWSKPENSEEINVDALEEAVGFEESREIRDYLKKDSLLRRVFHVGGEKVLQGEEDISIDVLGKAAHAIILRRSGKWEDRGRKTVEETPQAAQQVDLAAALERENTDPDLAEVIKNIHELQPIDTRVLPDIEFDALKLVLTRGFTKEQLQSYIHYTRTAVDFAKGDRPPWILHQSLWRPKKPKGKAPSTAATTREMLKKEKVVSKLVDECWGLVTESKQDHEGHIDVTLRDVEFGLLIAGTKRWLNQIARYFKSFPRHIELYPSTKVLRIMASRVICEAMLEEVNQVLRLKKTVSLDLDLVSAQPLSSETLEQVGQVTNTVIQLEPDGNRITMSWIHKVHHLEDFEDLGDVVLRFLLSAFGPKRRTTSVVAAMPPKSLGSGRYIVDHHNTTRLPWKDRRKQWSRWVSDATKSKDSLQAEDMLPVLRSLLEFEEETKTWNQLGVSEPGATLTRMSEGFTESIPDPAASSASPDGPTESIPESAASSTLSTWSPKSAPASAVPSTQSGWPQQPQASTRAVFGHVLHATDQLPGISPRNTKYKDLDRTFIPLLPPLSTLQFDKYYKRDRPRHCTLLLHFLPAPDQDTQLSLASPPLELRIEMDGDDLRQVLSLRAVVDTFIGDTMFPGRPVDVRVTQQRYFEMPGTGMVHDQPYAAPVLNFINASTLQVDSGNLRTPPRLAGLQIPRRLLRPASRHLVPGEGNNDKADFVQVDYRFSGLEIQRAVAAEFEDYTLWYRQVEAGQHGGNWSELALDASPAADAYSTVLDDWKPRMYEAGTFLASVSKLISQQHIKWLEDRKRG